MSLAVLHGCGGSSEQTCCNAQGFDAGGVPLFLATLRGRLHLSNSAPEWCRAGSRAHKTKHYLHSRG